MKLLGISTAFAVTAIASPVFAADISEPAPINPWEFYIGAHAGIVWGHGDWIEDFVSSEADLEGSRGIFGALAGFNYRFDSAFLGLEGDIGFATGDFDWDNRNVPGFGFIGDSVGCGNGAWCDWNSHIRLRAGIAVLDGLDLFVAGGVALADGEGDDEDAAFGDAYDKLFVGWSIGGGAELALTEHIKLRAEYIYDDYGDRHKTADGPGYNSDSDWADNTVRGAAIFTF